MLSLSLSYSLFFNFVGAASTVLVNKQYIYLHSEQQHTSYVDCGYYRAALHCSNDEKVNIASRKLALLLGRYGRLGDIHQKAESAFRKIQRAFSRLRKAKGSVLISTI